MSKEADTALSSKAPTELKFDFIKSNLFRVVHADGVWGGLTPKLGVHMAFFNERSPIPKQVVHQLQDAHTLGPELKDRRLERDALVREVEVDVVMDLETAKFVLVWLTEKIAEAEKISARLNQGTTREE